MESWYVTIESIEQTGKPGYVWYVNAIAVKGGPRPLVALGRAHDRADALREVGKAFAEQVT